MICSNLIKSDDGKRVYSAGRYFLSFPPGGRGLYAVYTIFILYILCIQGEGFGERERQIIPFHSVRFFPFPQVVSGFWALQSGPKKFKSSRVGEKQFFLMSVDF